MAATNFFAAILVFGRSDTPLLELSINPSFPRVGFLRLPQILGNPKADPPIPPVIPVSSATWWAGVKSGHYPRSVKLSARVTAWRADDIRALVARLSDARDGDAMPDSCAPPPAKRAVGPGRPRKPPPTKREPLKGLPARQV